MGKNPAPWAAALPPDCAPCRPLQTQTFPSRKPNTDEPMILSAGIIPIREIDGQTRFLLLRCFRYWDFPKGECAPGEDPLDTAHREIAEETGITDLYFRWGHVFTETPPYGRGKIARYYLAAAPTGDVTLKINPALGRPEHHEFRWVSANDAAALLNARLRSVLAWARDQID
jgi:bis(5'-nucleosidyl)-tetraphosphatase